MVFPNRFIKVVASGTLFQAGEIWSTSWSMADPNTSNDAEDVDRPEAFADAITAWFQRETSWISPNAVLDRVKVNLVGPDGRYVSQGDTVEVEIPDVPGGSAGQTLPPQCTCAVSLLSDRRRGPGSHGRFYPPLAGTPVQSDGKIQAAVAKSMADSASQLVRALADAGGTTALAGPGPLRVVNASAVGAGRFDLVTRVRVGRVVDTIQRRRNALTEEYEAGESPLLPVG